MTQRQTNFLHNLEKFILIGFGVSALVAGLVFGVIVASIAEGKELSLLASYRPTTPTRLYDRNGEVFAELYRHKQDLIRYQDIPPHVVETFLMVEDNNFFHHFGIDFPGIARAMIKNLLAGRVVQGGSTLTQQLAKQLYLQGTGERVRSYGQKIFETILALQIEEELSKEEILEVYFNVIYLGHGCQGLVCASRLYFDKAVQDLTITEAALLARLPKAPVELSPYKNPKRAMAYHKSVMEVLGNRGIIPAGQVNKMHYDFWSRYWKQVVVKPPSHNIWSGKLDLAPYFTDHVRQILETSPDVGVDRLYSGGLRVYTTLDLVQQQAAQDVMYSALRRYNAVGQRWARMAIGRAFDRIGAADSYSQMAISGNIAPDLFEMYDTMAAVLPAGRIKIQGANERSRFRKLLETETLDEAQLLSYFTPAHDESAAFDEFRKDTVNYRSNIDVQGAIVTLESSTGYITSMVGGAGFTPRNQFNRALQAQRQPGSAFKIFVYGAALEQRVINSSSSLNDAPLLTLSPDGRAWEPTNYEEGYVGVVSAETAMAASLNTCAVQTYYMVGAEPIIDLATRLMKIKDRNRFSPDPALALGASEVTPMEMATAVAIIGNDGKDVIPFAVRYVQDQSGNTMYNQESNIRKILALKTQQNKIQVIEPGLAYILRYMMRKVADEGTASGGVRGGDGYNGEFAAKTGTTSGWSDAWIVGFNPHYATATWFGFDQARTTLGPGQAGSNVAAPVIGRFYGEFYRRTGKNNPSFSDLPGGNEKTEDIVELGCEGLGLVPKTINGEEVSAPDEGVCGATEKYRIYDHREFLMKKMGISREEVGAAPGGKIKFKRETDQSIEDLRKQKRGKGLY